MRIMTFMIVNANWLSNKITSLQHKIYSGNMDVVHITETRPQNIDIRPNDGHFMMMTNS